MLVVYLLNLLPLHHISVTHLMLLLLMIALNTYEVCLMRLSLTLAKFAK